MDAQAHLNNAAFLDYLQEARVHFLLTGPPVMGQLLDTGVLVVQHQIEYLEPVVYSDRGLGHRAVGHLRRRQSVRTRATTSATGTGWSPGPGPAPCPFDLARNALRRLLAPRNASVLDRRDAADRAVARPCRAVPTEPRRLPQPAAGALVRPRLLRPRQQRQVLRLPAGGADPALHPCAAAGPGRPAARSGFWSARISTTAARWTSGRARTRCGRRSVRSETAPSPSAPRSWTRADGTVFAVARSVMVSATVFTDAQRAALAPFATAEEERLSRPTRSEREQD